MREDSLLASHTHVHTHTHTHIHTRTHARTHTHDGEAQEEREWYRDALVRGGACTFITLRIKQDLIWGSLQALLCCIMPVVCGLVLIHHADMHILL